MAYTGSIEEGIELKHFLIQRIEQSEDVGFLRRIWRQMDDGFVYEFTPEEESMIEEAEEELDGGQGIPYDVYLKEFDQWFEEIDEKCNC